MTARLPSMSSAQVLELSQPGRTSAVVCSCRPGWAPGFMMTRLYGRSCRSDGFQSKPPCPVPSQKVSRPGVSAGARVPLTRWVAIGRVPVPMSTACTVDRGTPVK
jgi:hypothetical protein